MGLKGKPWRKPFVSPRWMPKANFITLHCKYLALIHIDPDSNDETLVSTDLYIIVTGLSGLLILLPYGNITAIDAYFFGVSASTESGLNTYVQPV